MAPDMDAPRLLGAAFLFVVLTSLACGILLTAAAGSGSINEMLVEISNNQNIMHLNVLAGMLNSTGVVALAALLYIVLREQNKNIALVALGLWLVEAVFYSIMQVGLLGLIPLSQVFVNAVAPADLIYQTLAEFLYNGMYTQGLAIHMWFYCAGGMLWYYLFYRSRYIPRAISLFGIAAVFLGFAGTVVQLFGYDAPILLFLPILPFEILIGSWLMLRGIKGQQIVTSPGKRTTVGE